MYSSGTISDCNAHGYQSEEVDCAYEIAQNGQHRDTNGNEKSNEKSHSNGSTGTTLATSSNNSLKSIYSDALSNDNIVIVETSPPPPPQQPQKADIYRSGGGQTNRASRTIRGLSDEELPDPDVVRRAKDLFETLAKKQRQETSLKRHQSSVQDFSKLGKPSQSNNALGRSQSMLVLTGRAWCNGAPPMSTNGRPPIVIKNNDINTAKNYLKKTPAYHRSCSELDKFFQEEDDDDEDDLWERQARTDRGSPVSPEVIQKIRDQGTCVKFFGSEASVVEKYDEDDDMNEDAFLEEKTGYLLEYPYELYPSDGVNSKPRIIRTHPKTSNSSCASSVSSTYGGRETPSPAPTSPYGGWFIGGSVVSLDDIRASLKMDDSDRSSLSSSLSSGHVRLKQRYSEPCNGQRPPMALERCHGRWVKNPYWQGSYYVIYDFTTQKAVEPHLQINGN